MRTILCFDGGGTRGAISVAFLEQLEKFLCKGTSSLASKIDLVGGTSTGAIIAGAVALGKSASDIRQFYRELAPKVFRRRLISLPGISSKFSHKILMQEIQAVCEGRTLDSEDLQTGFALVIKRMETGSVWVLSNNSKSKFWNTPSDESFIGNRHYDLATLIRASAAAPHYFSPEKILIHEGLTPSIFIDGGVTPFNNPSLAFLKLVTNPSLGYGWNTGKDKLRIISIGTGFFRPKMTSYPLRLPLSASLAIKALSGMIHDCDTHTLELMQMLGHPKLPWTINSEVGDLNRFNLANEPLFDFIRLDVRLEREWLKTELDIDLTQKDIKLLHRMDNASNIPLLFKIGSIAAEKMITPDLLA